MSALRITTKRGPHLESAAESENEMHRPQSELGGMDHGRPSRTPGPGYVRQSESVSFFEGLITALAILTVAGLAVWGGWTNGAGILNASLGILDAIASFVVG
jgi:hypothetical protein